MNWDDHRIGWAVSGGCAVVVRFPGILITRAFKFNDILTPADLHNNDDIRIASLPVCLFHCLQAGSGAYESIIETTRIAPSSARCMVRHSGSER
jgi:hypothetical protein